MTPERIAEFHSAAIMVNDAELTELCRLARLGLRADSVGGIPTGQVWAMAEGDSFVVRVEKKSFDMPCDGARFVDKRVALVVLEDSD